MLPTLPPTVRLLQRTVLLPLKSARRSLVRLRQFPGIRRQRLLSKAESVLCYRLQQHWNSFEATHFVMALRESTIESGKSALYSSENMSHLSTRVHDSIRHDHYSPTSHLHGCTTRLSQRVVPDRCATHSADHIVAYPVAFGFDGGASRGLPSTAIADISCESEMLIDAQPPTTSAITCAVARALCLTHSKSTAERNSLALLLHCTALHCTALHCTATLRMVNRMGDSARRTLWRTLWLACWMSEAVWTMHEISSWYGSAAAIV